MSDVTVFENGHENYIGQIKRQNKKVLDKLQDL